MQPDMTIRKWSDLAGLAAITLDSGKKVGVLEDFLLEVENNTVVGLLIRTGVFGHRVLPVSAVNGTGADAITFTSEEQLIKENETPEAANLVQGKLLLAYRVLSESGTVIGEINNILLDVTTPAAIKIDSYQLAGGLRERFMGHHQTFAASEVLRYGKDVVIVSDATAQTLVK
jgi:uncharacterized protein YrrD